jgi:hypothetical protein
MFFPEIRLAAFRESRFRAPRCNPRPPRSQIESGSVKDATPDRIDAERGKRSPSILSLPPEGSMDGALNRVRILFLTMRFEERETRNAQQKEGRESRRAPRKLKKTAKKSQPAAPKKAKGKPAKAPSPREKSSPSSSTRRGRSGRSCSAPRLSIRVRSSACSTTNHRAGRQTQRAGRDPPQRQRGDPGHRQLQKQEEPWIVIERQYRHAANQYLWELPAGKLDAGRRPAGRRQARTGRGDRLQRQRSGSRWWSTTPAPASWANR